MAGKRIYELPELTDDISNSSYFVVDDQSQNWDSAKKVPYAQLKNELQGDIPEQLELTEKKLKYLYELTKGQAWDVEDGTSPAYAQTVPQGAKMAAINKIGGRSVLFNQLVNPNNLRPSASAVGLTLTKNGGKITISGTSTGANNLWLLQNYPLLAGHKYLLHSELTSNDFSIRMAGSSYNYSQNVIYSIANNETVSIQFFFGANVNCACVFHPQLFDLTTMFGAGSEPTSFAEFKAIFPNDFYAYNTGEIISAKTNKIVSKLNDTEIASYTIPQALLDFLTNKGYGESYDDSVNTLDIANKKYIQTGYYVNNEWVYVSEEYDISEYLSDDNLLEVEASGTLTFEQDNNTTIPVYNKTTYAINLSEVTP